MIVLFRTFLNIFRIEDLRNRIGYTLGVLAFFRLGSHVPLPGINAKALISLAGSASTGGFLSYLDIMSGGALRKGSVFALGIMPYITASIMMQILSVSIPHLEALSKEGEAGKRVIGQYTRYLTIVMSIIQSMTMVGTLEIGMWAGQSGSLFLNPGWASRLMSIFMLSVGSMFIMWLGEQITRYGIGYGSSLLIFANIVANLPGGIVRVLNGLMRNEIDLLLVFGIVAFVLALTACIVFMERGERRVPVQYARRVVGRRVFGGVNSYIPFKINSAGVMPVILSGPVVSMLIISSRLISNFIPALSFVKDLLDYQSPLMLSIMAITIIFFSYLYTSIIYNPLELAENIRKAGGFVPGIRPGRRTAECFNYILTRVGFPGAIYIAALAVVPDIAVKIFALPVRLSGLSLLIAVGVALDTASQIESFLIERKYEGFLGSKRRIKGRRA